MAASMLPRPGSFGGPCRKCQHKDCAHTRHMAESACRLCGDPIGYDRRYYDDPDTPNAWVHAACLEDAVEKHP